MNSVNLIGNLGKDPEIKYFESGTCKCTFSIAVTKYMGKDKDPKTVWINCEAWGKTAETIAEYFKQGNKIGIDGSLDTDTWEQDDGTKRSKTFVLVDKPHFIEKKKDGVTQQAATPKTKEPDPVPAPVEDEIDEDEIPF